MRNLITDVSGVLVGNAHDQRLASGVTAIVFEEPAAAAVDVRGGAAGTRETDLLDPAMLVERIDAITLSGGSAFGLDAAGGVQAWLREQGRGFAIRSARIPIVPGAILFDLLNGGDKDWGRFSPYRELGHAAATAAAQDFALGSVGAGLGATTVNLKGGLGSASATTSNGHTVGAVVAVNAVGSVVVGDGPWFWAAPFEQDGEFGGRGFPASVPDDALAFRIKGTVLSSTTLAVVATDAVVDEGAGEAPRRHGAGRSRPRDLSGARAVRRRHRVCGGDRLAAACRPGVRSVRHRSDRRERTGPRGGACRLRGNGPALRRRAAKLARQIRRNLSKRQLSARTAPRRKAPDRSTASGR